MIRGPADHLAQHHAPEGLLLASRRAPPRQIPAWGPALGAALGLMVGGWFGLARAPEPAEPPLQAVALVYHAPVASSVSVAGSFNGWDPRATPMVPVGEGAYRTLLWLPPGQHEYQFVIDGARWIPDPLAPRQRDDGFGSANSVLEL